MGDQHFTFLGCRTYDLVRENGEDVLRAVPGTGLGILRGAVARCVARSFAALPPEIRARAREAEPARADQGEPALDRAPSDVPRLRRRAPLRRERRGDRRTPLPRAVHVVGVQLEPDRRAAVAPQGRGSGRTGRVPPGQSRPEGPDRDPRDLSARRSLPDQRRVALRERDGDPAAAGTPARAHLPEPRAVRPLRVVHRVPPARSLHDTGAHADRRDPHRRVPGAEPRVERAPRRVGAGPAALRAARRSAPSAAFRHRRAGSGSRRGRRGRGSTTSATRSRRRAAKRPRSTCCTSGATRSLRPTATTSTRPRRWRTSSCSQSLEAEGALAVRPVPSRRAVRRPQALRRGHAAVALRRAAAPHQHGRHRRRRAPLHDHSRAGCRAGGSSTSGCASRRTRSRRGAVGDLFEDAFLAVLSGAAEDDGFNRLVLLAGLSWREVDAAARVQPLPAPDRHAVQPDLHVGGARRAPRHRPRARRAVRDARSTPGSTARATPTASSTSSKPQLDAVTSARRGPDPAQPAAPRARDAAHELVPGRRRATRRRRASCSSSIPTRIPDAAAPAPDVRDLRVRAPVRGAAPARRARRARRHPLVGPARGLPHRDPRPDEGAAREERGDRPERAPRAASS